MTLLTKSLHRFIRRYAGQHWYQKSRVYPYESVTRAPLYQAHARAFSERARAVVPDRYNEKDQEVVDSIKMLLDKRIAPVVQQDGGNVSFVSYDPETGFVYVRLSGACVGCAQSDVTLKHMIQGTLCHYLDEVTAVLNCDEDGFVISNQDDNEY
ncbi:NifU-like protein [Babesia sp. Xinjiang]|uniref:NifU-like protein n=1 Tax=Babesia sp. Xinjiang TaxID=462227 RepID=UPI000A22E10C|nr:NifU-like protein [Babesia sp. Xinjiang]ORM39985.1 NifU-like protein [Babesia sp. Xinjiang]